MFDFPNAPTNGQQVTTPGGTYQWDGSKWIAASPGAGGTASLTISDSPPANPVVGALWWDSVGCQMYLFYNDGTSSQWVPSTNQQSPIADAPNDANYYARHQNAWSNVATAPMVQNNVGRNKLHNALFNVQQRGQGPWTANNAYTADRWIVGLSADTVSFTVRAVTDAERTQIGDEAATSCLQNVFTGTANGSNYIDQRIEKVQRLAGKTVIVCFYANASVALQLGINLFQVFGTGGTPSGAVTVLATGLVANVTTTWTHFSYAIALPSAAGKTFGTNGDDSTYLRFYYSNAPAAAISGNIGQQSGTISIWGVQLEIAQPGQTTPTPLEKLDPADDLRHCQRFYQNGYTNLYNSYAVAGAGINTTAYFQVQMRGQPTIALSGTTPTNCTVSVATQNVTCVVLAAAPTATGQTGFATNWSASADL